ncbi:hypothetical protein KA005_85225 [bacterium]|nr:hypothetical protein [bacterium]
MKISTFDDDLLGLENFAERLERFITIEHQYVEGGLVIGLSSKFGSGKSTFFQMWKSSILEKQKEDSLFVILLNAWESDYYGDPLFAIISALVESIKKEGKSADKIIDAAKTFGWFSTAIGGQIVKKFSGIDTVAAGELAEKKKKGRDDKLLSLPDTFSIYEGRKNAMNSLRDAILEFVEGEQPKILFLIDELDRCRPDYAISYLETIKHIFDVKGAVFLLAADRKHLENSAKTAFGADLDFDEYYRKFVHREVILPDISDSSYKKIASKYVSFYLECDGARNCFMKLDSSRVENIVELVAGVKLTPRQIQEVFRIMGHIFETTEDKKGHLLWCLAVGSIMMAVLKIANPRIYNLLGSEQLSPQEAFDFFKDQLKDSYIDWWFILCLTGGGLKVKEDETPEIIMKNVGLISEDSEFIPSRDLGQWYSGWGRSSSHRFEQIYEKIEQLDQWS